ncbi:ABC transporter substrate-binding protein [Nonomuraea zeae]|uniref:ABC transporter substrate-binding protein n=1 Tax=Nonomuraea zeae TaxID=1642303 RepID=A0A5S4H628_9ACTN|nr:ABC transporter substrate-binding protein [Nonomuraea zeae]TMR34320.1 ABC transporter substrate-binding protein [Nonomuraea zeae]
MPARTRATAAGLALAAALAACGTAEPAALPAPATPQRGGTITFGLQSPPQSANPRQFTDTATVYIARQLADSLVAQDPATGEIVPWLARSWEVNENATRFTFHLRAGVTFPDGSPLTAEVVKANFDDLLANKAKLNPAITAVISSLKGAAATGADEVSVTFSRPNAPFLQAATGTALSILAPETLRLPFDQRFDKIVGSGPFVLDSLSGDKATLSRRAGYGWAPRGGKQGEAYLDKVVFTAIPESGVRAGSLESGQVQAIGDVPPADAQSLRDGGFQLVTHPNPGLVWGLIPISARAPLDDVRVRRAISLAVDGTEVRDTVLSPDFAPATSVLAATTPGYANLAAKVGFRPEEAARLLDEAGWTAGPDGVRAKGGKKLSLVVGWFRNYSANQRMLELIKARLGAVGVDLQLLEQTGGQLLDGLAKARYDFFWTNGTQADGDILRSSFSSAPPNYYRIDDPALERLLQQQVAIGGKKARDAVLAEIQSHLVDQALFIPVVEQTTVLAVAPSLHGITLGAASELTQLAAVWLS